MEPYTIISQIRKHHQWGPIFGTYIQPDIIGRKEDFKEILGPKYEVPNDRSIQPGSSILKKGDKIMLRVRRRDYYLQWKDKIF